jgi:parvulin-like peptidyl-prolyl isomerase
LTRNPLRGLLREPLLHFLLLGALLFAVDAWRRPPERVGAGGEIVVTEARVRTLAQNFARTWQRPPTREELDGLVESYVREEVMVREALALGLDRDDAIIRKRLQQKVEFVSDQAAALAAPSDAELEAYLAKNADAFRREPRVTFVQVYLDPARRGAALQADAERLRERLAAKSIDIRKAGDSLMLLQSRYDNAPQGEVARLFGTEFAEQLVKQQPGAWAGPLLSGYGAHLVLVETITPGGTPTLDEVRPLVEREWTNAKRRELAQEWYASLRSKYKVNIQMPAAARP